MKQQSVLKSIHTLYGKIDKIPETWDFLTLDSVTPLGDKTSIKMGPFGSDLKKHELLNEGEIKTLWIENIVHNKLNLDYKKYITKAKYQELKNFTVRENDVVLSMMGTVGRVAIIPNNIGTAIITSHLLKITLDQKRCLPVFLQYYFLSDFAKKQLNKESRGIVMQGLNTGIVKSLKIALPPIKEQQKIASILSNVDELIQKTDQIIEQTQRLKKGLMQRLLTKGIGHTKFKEIKSVFNKIEKIPLSWEFKQLENLTNKEKSAIRMGPFGSDLKKHELLDIGKIMVLWIENIVNNEMNLDYKRFISEQKYNELKGFTVKPDDVLITMMGTLGRIAIVPSNIGIAIISSHLLKITLDTNKCTSRFLYYYLLFNDVKKQISKESRGIVMEGLNTQIIKSLKIKLPSVQEQNTIVNILSNFDNQLKKLFEFKSCIEILKKGLMQQLLTGKIRIKV